MAIELRILSGARAGQTESFEKSVVAVGRHPLSDLRFDAERDLDVSTRHGEIRGIEGRYTIVDNNSTNGTFVNGERVTAGGSRELNDGDVIAFGAHGPTASVHITADRATPVGNRATEAIPTPALGVAAQPAVSSAPRRPTHERVAMAVAEQTRGLKIVVACAIIALGGVALIAPWKRITSCRVTAVTFSEPSRGRTWFFSVRRTSLCILAPLCRSTCSATYWSRSASIVAAARRDLRSAEGSPPFSVSPSATCASLRA